MKTKEYAALFLQAYDQNYIRDFSNWTKDSKFIDDDTCSSDCDTCPAPCETLSNMDGTADYSTFLKNFKPVYAYIQKHHPEYLI